MMVSQFFPEIFDLRVTLKQYLASWMAAKQSQRQLGLFETELEMTGNAAARKDHPAYK
jgi:DNA-binding GntR family transcriptional regulator